MGTGTDNKNNMSARWCRWFSFHHKSEKNPPGWFAMDTLSFLGWPWLVPFVSRCSEESLSGVIIPWNGHTFIFTKLNTPAKDECLCICTLYITLYIYLNIYNTYIYTANTQYNAMWQSEKLRISFNIIFKTFKKKLVKTFSKNFSLFWRSKGNNFHIFFWTFNVGANNDATGEIKASNHLTNNTWYTLGNRKKTVH